MTDFNPASMLSSTRDNWFGEQIVAIFSQFPATVVQHPIATAIGTALVVGTMLGVRYATRLSNDTAAKTKAAHVASIKATAAVRAPGKLQDRAVHEAMASYRSIKHVTANEYGHRELEAEHELTFFRWLFRMGPKVETFVYVEPRAEGAAMVSGWQHKSTGEWAAVDAELLDWADQCWRSHLRNRNAPADF